MARKKVKPGVSEESSKTAGSPSPRVTRTSSRRVTRSYAASSSVRLTSLPNEPPKKKAKKSSKKEKAKSEAEDSTSNAEFTKTLIIEHCKQCISFKTKATEVKNGLEVRAPDIKVLVNPEKARRGCFEIREKGGETFITLLDLKEPFEKLRELDVDEVISDILKKIKVST